VSGARSRPRSRVPPPAPPAATPLAARRPGGPRRPGRLPPGPARVRRNSNPPEDWSSNSPESFIASVNGSFAEHCEIARKATGLGHGDCIPLGQRLKCYHRYSGPTWEVSVSPSRRGIARDSRRRASGLGQRPMARATAGGPTVPVAWTGRHGCGVAGATPGDGFFVNPAARRAGSRGQWCAVAATTGLHRIIQQGRHWPEAGAGSHMGPRGILPLGSYLGSPHPGDIGMSGSADRACVHREAGMSSLMRGACVTGTTAISGQCCRPGSEARDSEGNNDNPSRRRSGGMFFQATIRNAANRFSGTRFGMPGGRLTLHRKRSSSSGT
jgi:hypothetical protein